MARDGLGCRHGHLLRRRPDPGRVRLVLLRLPVLHQRARQRQSDAAELGHPRDRLRPDRPVRALPHAARPLDRPAVEREPAPHGPAPRRTVTRPRPRPTSTRSPSTRRTDGRSRPATRRPPPGGPSGPSPAPGPLDTGSDERSTGVVDSGVRRVPLAVRRPGKDRARCRSCGFSSWGPPGATSMTSTSSTATTRRSGWSPSPRPRSPASPGGATRSSWPERRYPAGIPIYPEAELERLIRDEAIDEVVFAYSDVSHETVMHAASRAMAAGADFKLLGPARTMLASRRPVVAVGAVRTGSGKSQTSRYLAALLEGRGLKVVGRPSPDALRRARRPARPALRDLRRPRHPQDDDRGARGVRAAPRRRPGRLRRASTTRRSCAPPRARRTSSCGTAATTTCRSTGPTCTSSSPIRSGPATS